MYQNPFTERFLVIAEKPSVARTIAHVLACENKKEGYLEGPDGAVSWCFGHLAEYAMPEAYDERFRKWSLEALPIIPEKWKLEISQDKAKQFKVLKGLLCSGEYAYVVNACDAGRFNGGTGSASGTCRRELSEGRKERRYRDPADRAGLLRTDQWCAFHEGGQQ